MCNSLLTLLQFYLCGTEWRSLPLLDACNPSDPGNEKILGIKTIVSVFCYVGHEPITILPQAGSALARKFAQLANVGFYKTLFPRSCFWISQSMKKAVCCVWLLRATTYQNISIYSVQVETKRRQTQLYCTVNSFTYSITQYTVQSSPGAKRTDNDAHSFRIVQHIKCIV